MRRGPKVGFDAGLFESLVDPRLFEVPQELAIIGRLLDEGRFLETIRRKFTASKDRSCISRRRTCGRSTGSAATAGASSEPLNAL